MNINVPYLFRKLLFTEFVKSEEFLGEHDVLLETTTGKFDTNDDSSVWHHHSHWSELNLQVLWQLLTTGISRILWNSKWRTFKLSLRTILIMLLIVMQKAHIPQDKSSMIQVITHHSQEQTEFRIQVNDIAISEDELRFAFLLAS